MYVHIQHILVHNGWLYVFCIYVCRLVGCCTFKKCILLFDECVCLIKMHAYEFTELLRELSKLVYMYVCICHMK